MQRINPRLLRRLFRAAGIQPADLPKRAKAAGPPAGRETFGEAAESYLLYRRPRVAPRTYHLDRERLPPLLAAFGPLTVGAITPESGLAYRDRRLSQVGPRTVNLELGLLRRVLGRQGRLTSALRDALRKVPEPRHIPRLPTPEEKVRLFQLAAARRSWLAAYCAATITASTTLRPVEIRGLRWPNVDLSRGLLHVTVTKGRTAGQRTIPLNRDATRAFELLARRTQEAGVWTPQGYVFPAQRLDRSLDPSRPQSTWAKAWRNLTRAAGLRGLRFYDLRHLAITELCEQGIPVGVVQAFAGHGSAAMTGHYTHPRLPALRSAAGRLTICAPLQVELFDDKGRDEPARPAAKKGNTHERSTGTPQAGGGAAA